MKKLYRSETNSMVGGVLGGLGEYFEIDPNVIRLGFLVLMILTGIFPAVIAYIIAYFIIPRRPHDDNDTVGVPVEKPSVNSTGTSTSEVHVWPDENVTHVEQEKTTIVHTTTDTKSDESLPHIDDLMDTDELSVDDLLGLDEEK